MGIFKKKSKHLKKIHKKSDAGFIHQQMNKEYEDRADKLNLDEFSHQENWLIAEKVKKDYSGNDYIDQSTTSDLAASNFAQMDAYLEAKRETPSPRFPWENRYFGNGRGISGY